MSQPIPLSSGLGEVMAPQTLVTALTVAPSGDIKLDAGALHGRSELEAGVRFVRQKHELPNARPAWIVWVAIELDRANQPMRYHGLTASELALDLEQGLGYKSLADHVNRISEAIRGVVNIERLPASLKPALRQQLHSIGQALWEGSPSQLKHSLDV